jgi:hypothetical protein
MYQVACRAPKKKREIAYGAGYRDMPHGMVLNMHHGIFHMLVHILLGAGIGRPVVNRG